MNSRWKPVIIRSSCMCPCHDSRESFIPPPTPVCTSSVALVLPSCWRQTRLEFLLHRLKSVTSWAGSLNRDWSLFFTVCDWQYLQRALKLPSQLLIHMGNKRLWYQHRGSSLPASLHNSQSRRSINFSWFTFQCSTSPSHALWPERPSLCGCSDRRKQK